MINRIFRNNFFVALVLLIAYLLTNCYIYGWDDQHLEIPVLKHLIDPSLYKGDYYVESLCKYFTCWLYPVLAKFITVQQVPTAYFIIFLIARYFLFYWAYRLWLLISGSCFAAFSACLMFFLLGRTEEFLYRSLCHQEFSYMFVFAGFYLFYRERYVAAALVWGFNANIHALYSLFPMLYMLGFLFVCHPQRIKVCIQTGLTFILGALPFLCWQIPISLSREVGHSVPPAQWIPQYMIVSPQNFIFATTPLKDALSNIHIWWDTTSQYTLLTGLFLFHLAFNERFRRDHKVHAICGVSALILGVIYYGEYVHPFRMAVDLNLIRVEQFTRFFLMGYTTIWAVEQVRTQRPWLALAAALLMTVTGTTDLTTLCYIAIAAVIYSTNDLVRSFRTPRLIITILFWIAAAALIISLVAQLKTYPYMPLLWHRFMWIVIPMVGVFVAMLFRPEIKWLRYSLIIIPLAGAFIHFCIFSHNYIEEKNHGNGFWQLQRNWEDMQHYVHDHTDKDALIMTPYDMEMGGFRIHSERKVLVCYRDCGIIGFDYPAMLEWERRIKDIEDFKVFTNKPVDKAIINGIVKYHVNYIVFMRYYAPPTDNAILQKIYENEVFSLFKVNLPNQS